MRRFLLLCTVLLCMVNFTRAQESALPFCSAEQWDRMEQIRPRFDKVDALFESVETEADFLGYFAAAIDLRNDLWRDPPLCEPYLEIATLVSRILNDNVILNPLYWFYSGDSDTDRMLGGDEWSAGDYAYLFGLGAKSIASALGLGPWEASEQDGAVPACSYAQKQRVIRVKRQAYVEILRGAFTVDTVEDLLRYDDEQLAFRATAFADLPLCYDAYESAKRLTHISADFVAAHALAISGVAPASNPSLQQILESVERLPAWIIPREYRDARRVRRLFDNNLPACSAAQLAEVAGISHPLIGRLREFDERIITETTRQGMLASATIDIAWRAEYLPRFPKCAEAFEIALLMSQTGADIVAAGAISVSGAPRERNVYLDQVLRGVEALKLRLAQLPDTNAEQSAADVERDTLAPCTIPQLSLIGDMVVAPYRAAAQVALNLDGRGAVSRYAEAQFAWRADNLRYLPACSGAISLAYLLNSNMDSAGAAFALDAYARVITEANPYINEINAIPERFEGLITDLVALAPELRI